MLHLHFFFLQICMLFTLRVHCKFKIYCSTEGICHAGLCGKGLEIGERLDIAIDVAHAVTYLHTYTGMYYVTLWILLE